MGLSPNALEVLKARYLLPGESADELFWRVAQAIASRERRGRRGIENQFFDLLKSLRFLPNSPTLMNAGKSGGQLSACYVLPVEDSLSGIFQTLKDAAVIHQSGGGTGFAFTRVRPAGSTVSTTQGAASGPVSFVRIFDTATDTIKQGGMRRGANMAVLRVDHPDIEVFVESKRGNAELSNFNISVGVTDAFMRAVANDEPWTLGHPHGGGSRADRTLSARALFRRICEAAWSSGDPGLVFLDRLNQFNPTPGQGDFEATNPCGEQPLLPHESCNLGSFDVSKYRSSTGVRWARLAEDIELAVRFLDNVIDLNHFPTVETRAVTRKNRKIGLGVMGYADLLLELGIPYGSEKALELGERLMSFVDRQAKRASMRLARERGAFPAFGKSLWARLGYPKLRNATVSTVAPTGTISVIAGCSSGIEPIFSAVFARNVLDGRRLQEVHPAVLRVLGRRLASIESAEAIREALRSKVGPAWRPAHEVSVEEHVRTQAVFQRFSDSAVSKTINLPAQATVEDVAEAYSLAYRWGCKGITVYRDRSKAGQVLEVCETC